MQVQMPEKYLAVVVAAGEGNRLGRPEGKAMVALAGRPLFFYSLETLLDLPPICTVALVVRPRDEDAIRRVLDGLRPGQLASGRVRLVPGGATRQESVANGLKALAALPAVGPGSVVLIHDAARPLLSMALAAAVASAARDAGNGTVVAPVLPVTDSIRAVGPAGAQPQGVLPPREHLRLMQTPQAGFLGNLIAVHNWAKDARGTANDGGAFADDVSLAEAFGLQVRLVPGDRRNVKVTLPEDLDFVEGLLKAGMVPKTGIGFDVHPLRPKPGGAVKLGGVEIPADLELLGHSDADVAAHAAMDALLGACSAGDIGMWFPPGDPQWRGADSIRLLRTVWTSLAGKGLVFGNLDLTIHAERPRLAPHYDAMRRNIADAVGCRIEDISVKATTMEGLGAIGRGEGISAIAVATVFRHGP